MTIVAYILAIVAANVITARTLPLAVGPLLVPWGTWFIGLTLLLRDFVQLRHGRAFSYGAIAGALVASAITSRQLGDPLAITAASAVSFAFSESLETEVFSRLRAFLAKRIFWSGTFGSLVDSVLFVTLGLSPLTTGFVPWAAVPGAILGQYIVKTAMVSAGAVASSALRQRLAPSAAA
ncbi:MAG TPA: VUT family protein [Chloroflexota bacterium]|nr:VUT family protein [Chloroflexota bacterium]